MKCHTNVNSTPFTQLPRKFSYIVAILGHNHFESPNTYLLIFSILHRSLYVRFFLICLRLPSLINDSYYYFEEFTLSLLDF
jgi:hypothetical protein